MGAISSPGKVICSRATCLPLHCSLKTIPDGHADALLTWNEVVSNFILLKTATCVGSWIVVRAGEVALVLLGFFCFFCF